MARLGMVLYHGIDNGPELQGYGRLAEEAGFESLWVTERYFHEETFSLLGYLAASTTSLGLGLGVVNPYTRHPALLAMASATLDRLSGGRFRLGLGRSDRFVIQDQLGLVVHQVLFDGCFNLPLPLGEGWGEGLTRRRFPPHPSLRSGVGFS